MLAELAAANAAFEIVKQTVQNGKEIYEAGEALAQYFGLKTELQRKAHKHGHKSDLEAFMAAEQLAAREVELKEMMIYQGRGGMWDDWLAYQAEMKRSRDEDERQKKVAARKRRAIILNGLMYTALGVATALLIMCVVYITLTIIKT